jgi:hypothetical protein
MIGRECFSSRHAGGTVSDQTDVLQGTLDLLIMRTIDLEPGISSAAASDRSSCAAAGNPI